MLVGNLTISIFQHWSDVMWMCDAGHLSRRQSTHSCRVQCSTGLCARAVPVYLLLWRCRHRLQRTPQRSVPHLRRRQATVCICSCCWSTWGQEDGGAVRCCHQGLCVSSAKTTWRKDGSHLARHALVFSTLPASISTCRSEVTLSGRQPSYVTSVCLCTPSWHSASMFDVSPAPALAVASFNFAVSAKFGSTSTAKSWSSWCTHLSSVDWTTVTVS